MGHEVGTKYVLIRKGYLSCILSYGMYKNTWSQGYLFLVNQRKFSYLTNSTDNSL